MNWWLLLRYFIFSTIVLRIDNAYSLILFFKIVCLTSSHIMALCLICLNDYLTLYIAIKLQIELHTCLIALDNSVSIQIEVVFPGFHFHFLFSSIKNFHFHRGVFQSVFFCAIRYMFVLFLSNDAEYT